MSRTTPAAVKTLGLALLVATSCGGQAKPATTSAAQAGGPTARHLEHVDIRFVAPGIWMHTSSDAQLGPANGLIAVTPRGLVLVDTGWTAQVARDILAFGDTELKERWALAIVTHSHVDRSGGLAALAERHIPVQAAPRTLELLAAKEPAVAAPPTIAFTEEVRAGEGYALFDPGAGHSKDNIVVWFPAQKVLFGGCFIKELAAPSLGFTGDADLEHWPAAIAAVARRYPEVRVVVPGHGQPGPAALLAHTAELLAAQQKR